MNCTLNKEKTVVKRNRRPKMRERNVDVPYSKPEIKEHHLRDGFWAPYGITYSATVYLRQQDSAIDLCAWNR
jgi:hypothetical protein